MRTPDNIQVMLDELGFVIAGWDEKSGAIAGHGETFVGSHDEVSAYLQAWAACRRSAEREAEREAARTLEIDRGVMVLRSERPITSRDPYFGVFGRADVPFRGDRLAVADAAAPFFDVLDVRVGTRSVLSHRGPASAELYAARIDQRAKLDIAPSSNAIRPFRISISAEAEAEFGRALSFPICAIAQDIIVQVALKDRGHAAVPRHFEAMVLGRVVQRPR